MALAVVAQSEGVHTPPRSGIARRSSLEQKCFRTMKWRRPPMDNGSWLLASARVDLNASTGTRSDWLLTVSQHLECTLFATPDGG
jgi:hypothetical protein